MENEINGMSMDAMKPPAAPLFKAETKKMYADAFLTTFSVGERKCVQATAELVQRLKRIVNLIGYGTVTVGSYVQSIVESHFLEHGPVIGELQAASIAGDGCPEGMVELSHEAKVYQAKYLTGDKKVRTLKGIYMNRDVVDKLHRVILDVNSEHPTCGSYLDAIVSEHIMVCEDLIADIVNDKMRKTTS